MDNPEERERHSTRLAEAEAAHVEAARHTELLEQARSDGFCSVTA